MYLLKQNFNYIGLLLLMNTSILPNLTTTVKIYFYRFTREVMQLKKTYQYLNLTQPNHNCENNNINKYAFIGSLGK